LLPRAVPAAAREFFIATTIPHIGGNTAKNSKIKLKINRPNNSKWHGKCLYCEKDYVHQAEISAA
jgi:hypothetical protein